MHARAQIRRAAVLVLTGLPTTAGRVYSGRTRALAKEHSPTLLVYCTDEQSDTSAMGNPPTLGRTVSVIVEGRATENGAQAAADLEDTLDQIAAEVEVALAAAPPLGGLVDELTLTGSRLAAEAPGESHAGEVRMEFRVVYRTKENAPHVALQ